MSSYAVPFFESQQTKLNDGLAHTRTKLLKSAD